MINSDKDLDKLFQDKLAGEQMTPSPRLWDDIEAELDEKKRRPGFIYWLSGLLGVALLIVGVWVMLGDHSSLKEKNSGNKTIAANGQRPSDSTRTSYNNSKDVSNNGAGPVANDPNVSENHQEPDHVSPDHSTSSNNSNSSDNSTVKKNISNPSNDSNPSNNSSPSNPSNTSHNPGGDHSITLHQSGRPLTGTSNQSNPGGKTASSDSSSTHSGSGPTADPSLHPTIVIVKKDSGKSDPVQPVVVQPKKDSVPQLIVKKDSAPADTSRKPSAKDPVKPLPEDPLLKYYVSLFAGIDRHHLPATPGNTYQTYKQTLLPVYENEFVQPLSYSYGAHFGCFLGKRLAVDGALSYSTHEQESGELIFKYHRFTHYDFTLQTSFGNVTFPSETFDLNDHSGQQGDTVRIAGHVKEKYQYLTLPLSARFNFINSRLLKIYARGGVSGSYVVGQDLDFTVTKSGKTLSYSKVNELSALNLGLVFGLGTELRICKGLGAWLEPGVHYEASSATRTRGIKNHPWALTVPVGLIYHF